MIALVRLRYALRHAIRKQYLRLLFRQYRRAGKRAGITALDGYSDTALLTGMLALRRMETTGETYATACAAVLPDVAVADLTR
jgi:hypothetical protein